MHYPNDYPHDLEMELERGKNSRTEGIIILSKVFYEVNDP